MMSNNEIKLIDQISKLEYKVKAKDKEIERLERLLGVYKKYSRKKAVSTGDIVVPNNEETIGVVLECRINKDLVTNKHYNVGVALMTQCANKIMHFMATPDYRKKMEELIP